MAGGISGGWRYSPSLICLGYPAVWWYLERGSLKEIDAWWKMTNPRCRFNVLSGGASPREGKQPLLRTCPKKASAGGHPSHHQGKESSPTVQIQKHGGRRGPRTRKRDNVRVRLIALPSAAPFLAFRFPKALPFYLVRRRKLQSKGTSKPIETINVGSSLTLLRSKS